MGPEWEVNRGGGRGSRSGRGTKPALSHNSPICPQVNGQDLISRPVDYTLPYTLFLFATPLPSLLFRKSAGGSEGKKTAGGGQGKRQGGEIEEGDTGINI